MGWYGVICAGSGGSKKLGCRHGVRGSCLHTLLPALPYPTLLPTYTITYCLHTLLPASYLLHQLCSFLHRILTSSMGSGANNMAQDLFTGSRHLIVLSVDQAKNTRRLFLESSNFQSTASSQLGRSSSQTPAIPYLHKSAGEV